MFLAGELKICIVLGHIGDFVRCRINEQT